MSNFSNCSGYIRFDRDELGQSLLIEIDSIESISVISNGSHNSFRIMLYSKSGREYLLTSEVRRENALKIEIDFLNTLCKIKESKYNPNYFKPFYPDDDDESGLCRNNSFEIMGLDFPETFLQK